MCLRLFGYLILTKFWKSAFQSMIWFLIVTKKNKENKNIKQYDQIQTSNHENKHQNALKLFGSM